MAYALGRQGNRVFYRVVGDRGPHVVLLQGLGLSGRFWFSIPESLAEDPEHPQRVITPDNRGTGGSDLPARFWTMADMADDVVAVLDHAGVGTAVVVGISLGGMIAQHVALRHPDRVGGLVLLATTAGLTGGKLPGVRQAAAVISMPLRGSHQKIEALGRLLLPASQWHRSAELLAGWPALLAQDGARPWAHLCQLAAVLGHSTGSRLSDIRCPTAVLTGAEDALVPKECSELLARRIPNATLDVLPRVAHAIPIQDPTAVRRAITRVRFHLAEAAA